MNHSSEIDLEITMRTQRICYQSCCELDHELTTDYPYLRFELGPCGLDATYHSVTDSAKK